MKGDKPNARGRRGIRKTVRAGIRKGGGTTGREARLSARGTKARQAEADTAAAAPAGTVPSETASAEATSSTAGTASSTAAGDGPAAAETTEGMVKGGEQPRKVSAKAASATAGEEENVAADSTAGADSNQVKPADGAPSVGSAAERDSAAAPAARETDKAASREASRRRSAKKTSTVDEVAAKTTKTDGNHAVPASGARRPSRSGTDPAEADASPDTASSRRKSGSTAAKTGPAKRTRAKSGTNSAGKASEEKAGGKKAGQEPRPATIPAPEATPGTPSPEPSRPIAEELMDPVAQMRALAHDAAALGAELVRAMAAARTPAALIEAQMRYGQAASALWMRQVRLAMSIIPASMSPVSFEDLDGNLPE